MSTPAAPTAGATARAYEAAAAHCRAYAGPSDAEGAREVAWTLAAYAAAVAWMAAGHPRSLAAAAVAAVCVMRSFVLLHDCGHGTLFGTARRNAAAGRLLSALCLTGFDAWRRLHAAHHRTFAALDEAHRSGQTILFTRRQYEAMPAWRRALVRVAREPAVFFLAVPLLKWGVQYPVLRGDRYTAAGLVWLALLGCRVSAWLPLATYAAGVLGLALFHWQHAVNGGYRAPSLRECDGRAAALRGSSYLALPPPLDRVLGGIGYHHVHHVEPRVPGHRLARCHAHGERLGLWPRGLVTRVGWREAARSLRYTMWDEATGRFVPF